MFLTVDLGLLTCRCPLLPLHASGWCLLWWLRWAGFAQRGQAWWPTQSVRQDSWLGKDRHGGPGE
eukprot:scaffold79074_cov21-Tisochrysis_lutea.AAC.2